MYSLTETCISRKINEQTNSKKQGILYFLEALSLIPVWAAVGLGSYYYWIFRSLNQDILGREACISLHGPIISMLFAMREGSLTLRDKVRSPRILDRLMAFGRPSRRHLPSGGFCSAQGRKRPLGKPRVTAHVPEWWPLWEQEWVCTHRSWVTIGNQLLSSVETKPTFVWLYNWAWFFKVFKLFCLQTYKIMLKNYCTLLKWYLQFYHKFK